MGTFTVGSSIRAGWETFKKRPWILIGAFAVTMVISWILGWMGESVEQGVPVFAMFVLSLIVDTFIAMGMTNFTLKAYDAIDTASLHDLWHPKTFWPYLAVSILFGIGVALGIVLLIVPGIIVFLTYQFGQYIVVDRNLGPIEALKESARMTRGHKWELLVLLLAVSGINILGFIALLVGLLVTVPVSALAVIHAYRVLGKQAAASATA